MAGSKSGIGTKGRCVMRRQVTRRPLIGAGVAVAALGAWPGGIGVHFAMAADTKVRMSFGLRATLMSIAWIGSEAGAFRKHGLDVSFPKLEVGGPEAAAGMMRGDWEFSQTGTLPIVEGVLNGGDPVILLRNTAQHAGFFVMSRPEFPSLAQLAGKRVGVLTDVYSGQAGVNTRRTLEKAGVTATYIGLGTFQKIYAALVAAEIEAGILVCTENSDSNVLVMQSTEERKRRDAPDPLDRARERRIFVQ